VVVRERSATFLDPVLLCDRPCSSVLFVVKEKSGITFVLPWREKTTKQSIVSTTRSNYSSQVLQPNTSSFL
jgi:hypothetical protein